MKMLVVHETELYSQSPVTLNKLNIQMPERKDVTLLRDSITGKAGFSAHFTLANFAQRQITLWVFKTGYSTLAFTSSVNQGLIKKPDHTGQPNGHLK